MKWSSSYRSIGDPAVAPNRSSTPTAAPIDRRPQRPRQSIVDPNGRAKSIVDPNGRAKSIVDPSGRAKSIDRVSMCASPQG
jgi:hypothetical protein